MFQRWLTSVAYARKRKKFQDDYISALKEETRLWKQAAEALETENNLLRAKLGYPPIPPHAPPHRAL